MYLFHASKFELEVGKVLVSTSTTCSYERASEQIDLIKPKNATARKLALYSADTAEFAYYFMMNQISEDEIKLYKVEVEESWKSVFSVTNAISIKLKQEKSICTLVNEYWYPTKDWNFYEYLSPSFKVIEKIENPKHNEYLMQTKYNDDFDLATSIS